MIGVAALYEQRCRENGDINEHLPRFVELCEELQAKRIIELGVRDGVSTAAWLYGLEATGGHLWSVDLTPAPVIPTGSWTFVLGNDTAPSTIANLPDDVDLVFIDTDHTYEQTLHELALYRPRVRPGGRIVLHDTEVERPENTDDRNFPVKRAVTLFCQANGFAWTNYENNNGLAVIEIP